MPKEFTVTKKRIHGRQSEPARATKAVKWDDVVRSNLIPEDKGHWWIGVYGRQSEPARPSHGP